MKSQGKPHAASVPARQNIHRAVLTLALAGLGIVGALSASSAEELYGATQGSDPSLYTFDARTGLATLIGAPGALGAQVSALSFDGSTLYGGTLDGSLLKVDTGTGVGTPIGSGSGLPIYGLAPYNNSLYGLEGALGGPENLVKINPNTGSVLIIGPAQDSQGDPIAGRGLTLYHGQLITADAGFGSGGDLFAIDPTTGLATDLTSSGTGIGIEGLSGLANYGGSLFASNNDPAALGIYTVNPATADTALLASNDLRLGALTAVPEPGTLAIGAACAFALALPLRRRRRA